MPSILLSDNGVSSGSAGLKSTAASDGALALQTTTAGGSATNAVYIDTSQNVGVGTSSPLAKLDVKMTSDNYFSGGIRIGRFNNTTQYGAITNLGGLNITCVETAFSSPSIVFNTSTDGSTITERARIDTSGNLLVGTTTSDARVRASGTGTVGRFVADGGSYTGNIISADTSGTAAGTGFNLILLQAGGANQFRVRGDGTIYAQNTSVQSISDERIKENIVDSTDGLQVVTALRPVRFDFKEKFGNNRKNQLGFIAQEVEQVFPDAVDVWGESDEPAEPYKSVGSGTLIPVLVKAIQELKAIVDAQAVEIAALKGN